MFRIRAGLVCLVAVVGCGSPIAELGSGTLGSARECEFLAQKLTARAADIGGVDGHEQAFEILANLHARLLREAPQEPDTRRCSTAYATMLREFALARDRQARLRRSLTLARAADDYYDRYLALFGRGSDAYLVRFSYAELLWDLEEWAKVGEQYQLVVAQDPAGEFSQSAARRAVMNRSNWFCCGESPSPDQIQSRRPIPLASCMSKNLAAYDLYLSHFADAEFATQVRDRRADLLYRYNHFFEAARAYDDIVRRTPLARLSVNAAAALLETLRVTGAAADAAAWTRIFRQVPSMTARTWENNWLLAQMALALNEPAPEPLPLPNWNGEVPDVIPGQAVHHPFLPDDSLERLRSRTPVPSF